MEFIESRLFTRRLHDLAGDAADELLRAIQSELEQNPGRGAMVPGLGGVRKVRMWSAAACRRFLCAEACFGLPRCHLERSEGS